MEPILTRCGYRCDLCLAYKPNVEQHPSNQQKLSDGWYQYFGFRMMPEDIVCDGCMADQPSLIDQNCPVRPCVMERRLANCANCEDYICDKLTQRLVALEEIEQNLGVDIPPEDYQCFILPYENKKRLAALRKEIDS